MIAQNHPKLYHICHVDRLPSIVASGGLLSDAAVQQHALAGTVIGMGHIKQRRLTKLQLASHPGLFVGQCVPFYYCPRSVMLYLIARQNAELVYRGGQGHIIHLEADMHATVAWANAQGRKWAFTDVNAGSRYFDDWADLAQLGRVDWSAVQARNWSGCKERKQAEFLLENCFPWELVERIGVMSRTVYAQAANALPAAGHRPPVEIRPDWYY